MSDHDAPSLQLIADSVFIIKKAFGPTMSAQRIVELMVRDLVLLKALPIHVDCVDGWWVVASAKDWLLGPDGSALLDNFRHIVHFPEAGREACHSEILVTAFAGSAVTQGIDKVLTWVTGDRDQRILPAHMLQQITRDYPGRVVAFTLSQEP